MWRAPQLGRSGQMPKSDLPEPSPMDFYNLHKVSRWSKCRTEPLVCSFFFPATPLTATYDRRLANTCCTAMFGTETQAYTTPPRPARPWTNARSHCSPNFCLTGYTFSPQRHQWPGISMGYDQRVQERMTSPPRESGARPRPFAISACWDDGKCGHGYTCNCWKKRTVGG